MKKYMIWLITLTFIIFLSSCTKTIEVTKGDVLDAIQSYKDTLYRLGASSHGEALSHTNALSLESKIDKDKVIPFGGSAGIDLEWLDMAVIVLNFSEAIANTDYTLGDEVILHNTLEDRSMWGWGTSIDTTVILSYMDEILYLRVTDPNLVQTFYFQYNDEEEIVILRLYETLGPEMYSLYIEDFVESQGINFWYGSAQGIGYTICTTVHSSDGGKYFYYISNDQEPQFISANYMIDDITLSIYKTNEGFNAYYDLYDYQGYNGFDVEGNLYFDDSQLTIDETIQIFTIFTDPVQYALVLIKSITEGESLSVDAIQLSTDLTTHTISSHINDLKDHIEIRTTYDFTLDYEAMLLLLGDMLYHNTHQVLLHFETNTDTILPDLVLYRDVISRVPFYDLEKEGYEFVGWSLSENGELYDDEYITLTEETTLYAVWQKVE